MNTNWEYVPFEKLFVWREKSKIKSNDGQSVGKYKMFVCSDTTIKYCDKYLEQGESIIFGTGGKASCHFESEPFAYSTDCVVAQKNSNALYTKFYYYYFRQNNIGEIQKTFTGSGLQHTSKKKIGKINVPICDIADQQRIVAKIEELFSTLDKGVAELNNVKEHLTVYRQAVLKEAFAICSDIKTVRDVCLHVTDGDHMPPPKSTNGIPFIMISNIEKNIINFSNTHYVDENYFRNIGEKRTPVKGDVLYTVTGSYGIPVLVDFDKEFCFQRHIALLRPNTKVITQKYLYYALQTNSVYQQATEKATGTAQKTVGLGVLRNIKIPYIELGRQLNIVLAIESKLSVCDKIEQTVDETLQKAEQLRQSILKQAFEGRLV
jgi:type I restriction enzyme S subunit